MSEFILMLTRDDVTVPDARALYRDLAATGVRHVGCKDVGLDLVELRELIAEIRADGHVSYLEVVAETPDATLASARAAVEVQPDYLIGGTLVEPVQAIIAGSAIRFFPYVGRIVGHPCLLGGTIAEIVADAQRVEAQGVDGINLLAYRYDGDVPALVRAVQDAVSIPVICAGSVDSLDRVAALRDLDVWAFTIGTAVLDRAIVPAAPLAVQVRAVLGAVRQVGS
jgi:4-hydroxythreonine-4-phosphate dehydrogenase